MYECKKLLKALLAKIQRKLSISETLPEGYILFITTFLEFCYSLTTVFWQQATLGTCIPTSLFAPILLSVYSHLFVSSSAYVTMYWFGVVHWANRKKIRFLLLLCKTNYETMPSYRKELQGTWCWSFTFLKQKHTLWWFITAYIS